MVSPIPVVTVQGAIVNRTMLIHMQRAASAFHTRTSETTLSPLAPLVLSWVLCHMEARGGGARQKEHFVSRIRKYTWKRKEHLLNKIRRESIHADKILE